MDVESSETSEVVSDCDSESISMFPLEEDVLVGSAKVKPFTVDVHINGKPVTMEIDTGSGVSILNSHDFNRIANFADLRAPSIRSKGFSGSYIDCVGEMELPVPIESTQKSVLLRVAKNVGPSLLGRDMLTAFSLTMGENFQHFCQAYCSLFTRFPVGRIPRAFRQV